MRAFERGATRVHTATDGFKPEFCTVTFYREVSITLELPGSDGRVCKPLIDTKPY